MLNNYVMPCSEEIPSSFIKIIAATAQMDVREVKKFHLHIRRQRKGQIRDLCPHGIKQNLYRAGFTRLKLYDTVAARANQSDTSVPNWRVVRSRRKSLNGVGIKI